MSTVEAEATASEAVETQPADKGRTAGEPVETSTESAPSSGAATGRPLEELMLAANEVTPGARVVFERGGDAGAMHGHLGREGKRFEFYLRGFDVRNAALRYSPGAALVVTGVERWARQEDVSVRLFDWLLESPPGRLDLEREREFGFVTRMRQLGIPATGATIERHSLPPGLGQASMAAVIHFTAAGERSDAVVVLFECGHHVGSVDVVGMRESIALEDVVELATLTAQKMGRVCD